MTCFRSGLAGLVAAVALTPAAAQASARPADAGHGLPVPTALRAMETMGRAVASCPASQAPRQGNVLVARASGALANPGSQLWVSRYNVVVQAFAMAVSPNGSMVFVAGIRATQPPYSPVYDTIAYNARTGSPLWDSQIDGFGNGGNPASVAVSPNGNEVFVTGNVQAQGIAGGSAAVTVAYAAASGSQLWMSTAPYAFGSGNSVTVSPNGTRIFVTGESTGPAGNDAYLTIAYSAATGRQQWVRLYNGRANDEGIGTSVAVSPDGAAVYVTGNAFATVAYNAATGATLWTRHYFGIGAGSNSAISVAVSPSGGAVYVTGNSPGLGSGEDYATIAYNAATGATLWKRRYNGPVNGNDISYSQAVSPNGTAVFVTGASAVAGSGQEYATIAYDAATGATMWERRYVSPASDNRAMSVAVSPDASTVYVTGASFACASSFDYSTIAYNAATGAQSWIRRYSSPDDVSDIASEVTVSPAAVFVTGSSAGELTTVAYSG